MSELGFLDQAMFKLEVAGMSPMYMCGGFVLETADSPYPVNSQVIADHLAACMEDIPLMRKRLVQDPLKLGNLRLVEDPGFDVRKHITCSVLDAPGDSTALMAALGAFSGRRMDLASPLWHFEIIEGLEDAKIAVVAHIHHAIMDGMEGMRIVESMLSERPKPGRRPRKHPRQAAARPTPIGLLSGALLENLQRFYIKVPNFAWNNTGPVLRNLAEMIVGKIEKVVASDRAAGSDAIKVYKTSLNTAPISAGRTVAILELPLKEINTLSRTFDCSINDLALLFNSSALEHYFVSIGEVIDFDLIAGMPINVRSEGDRSAGNALSLGRVNLHNTIGDVQKRLRAISTDTAAIKHSVKSRKPPKEQSSEIDYRALGDLVSPFLLGAMAYCVVNFNLLEKVTFINVGISNLPGNKTPPYLAGAKIRTLIPMAPPADSLALTITVTSTAEHLIFTYHGCAETISDAQLFVEGARRGFEELKKSTIRRRKPASVKARSKRAQQKRSRL